jgi:hypothetical protein
LWAGLEDSRLEKLGLRMLQVELVEPNQASRVVWAGAHRKRVSKEPIARLWAGVQQIEWRTDKAEREEQALVSQGMDRAGSNAPQRA